MTKEEFDERWGCEHRWAPAHRGPDKYCIKCGILNCEPDLPSDLRSVLRGETSELLKQRDELLEKVKKLEFMIDKGLGWDDMKNDITMPHEI